MLGKGDFFGEKALQGYVIYHIQEILHRFCSSDKLMGFFAKQLTKYFVQNTLTELSIFTEMTCAQQTSFAIQKTV